MPYGYYKPYWVNEDELEHHGIKGQKWGVRRFQNEDGSLTALGKKHAGVYNKQAKGNTHQNFENKIKSGINKIENKMYLKADAESRRDEKAVYHPQSDKQKATFDSRYPTAKDKNQIKLTSKNSNGLTVEKTIARYGTQEADALIQNNGPLWSGHTTSGVWNGGSAGSGHTSLSKTYLYADSKLGAVVYIDATYAGNAFNPYSILEGAFEEANQQGAEMLSEARAEAKKFITDEIRKKIESGKYTKKKTKDVLSSSTTKNGTKKTESLLTKIGKITTKAIDNVKNFFKKK